MIILFVVDTNLHNIYIFCFPVAGVRGDPHFTTLDGTFYTFNGYGEYVVLQLSNHGEFELQGRMVTITDEQGRETPATALTAFAAKGNGSDIVQVRCQQSVFLSCMLCPKIFCLRKIKVMTCRESGSKNTKVLFIRGNYLNTIVRKQKHPFSISPVQVYAFLCVFNTFPIKNTTMRACMLHAITLVFSNLIIVHGVQKDGTIKKLL